MSRKDYTQFCVTIAQDGLTCVTTDRIRTPRGREEAVALAGAMGRAAALLLQIATKACNESGVGVGLEEMLEAYEERFEFKSMRPREQNEDGDKTD